MNTLSVSVAEQIDGVTVEVALQLSCEACTRHYVLSPAQSASEGTADEAAEAIRQRLVAALRPLLPAVRHAAEKSLLEQSLSSLHQEFIRGSDSPESLRTALADVLLAEEARPRL